MGFNVRWPLLWMACLATIALAGSHFHLSQQTQNAASGLAALSLVVLILLISPAARHNLRRGHQWVGDASECEACRPASSTLYRDF
jgi:hypothetical protein